MRSRTRRIGWCTERSGGWETARSLGLLAILTITISGCLSDAPLGPESSLSAFTLLGGLETGQALSLEGREAESLRLPGGREGSEFVLVTFFGTEAEGSLVTVEIQGSDLVDVVGPPSASRKAVSGPLDLEGPKIPGTAPFHRELRKAEIRDLEPRLETAPWRSPPGAFLSMGDSSVNAGANVDPTSGASPAPAAVPPGVGDTIPLRVITGSGSDICAGWTEQAGRVAAVTEDVIMVSDTASPAELSDAEFQQFAQEFDQLVRPVEVEAFGEPTDIDDNDRVIVFFTPVVNEQGAGGFTFTGDLFPRSECEASNEGEIFYIISPDPNGVTPIQIDTETVARLATGIIGHEFQHLINAGRRIYVNQASTLESVWLNEGLSHIAEELLFYEQTPLGPGQNITLSTLQSSTETVDAANRFMVENLFRYAVFSATPTDATFLGSDNTATRGAAWSFLRYAADQEQNPDFFFELVNSTTRGLASLDGVLASADPLDLYQAWTASVFSDDVLADLPPFLSQPSWNHRTILPEIISGDDYPLDIQVVDGAGPIQVSLTGGGAAFFRVGVDAAGIGEFSVDASGTASQDLRVTVVRAD